MLGEVSSPDLTKFFEVSANNHVVRATQLNMLAFYSEPKLP